MTKNYFVKLCVLIVVAAMMLSLFACDTPRVDPEITTTGTEQSTNEETTKAQETTTAEKTTATIEATTTEGEATTTEGEAATTEGEVTTTKAEETTTKGEVTTTKGEVTTTKAEETTTKGEETTTKAEETTTKAEETTTKAEETTTEPYEGPADEREVAKIIVIGGQSNAEGAAYSGFLEGVFGAQKANEYFAGYNNVLSLSRTGGMGSNLARGVAVKTTGKIMAPSVNSGNTNAFGPELGIAEYLATNFPDETFYIVKYAIGGSCLATEWYVGSNGAENGVYLRAMEKKLENAIRYIDEELDMKPEIIAFCWMQGESDASATLAPKYYDNQLALINYLRAKYAYYSPKGGMAFIDAGISDTRYNKTGNYYWPEYKQINATKEAISKLSSKNYYFDTIKAGLSTYEDNADYAHYGVESMIKLGHLFGECIGQVLESYEQNRRPFEEIPEFESAPTSNEAPVLSIEAAAIVTLVGSNDKYSTALKENGNGGEAYARITFTATGGNIPRLVRYQWGARYLVIKYRASKTYSGYLFPNSDRETAVGSEQMAFSLPAGDGETWQYAYIDLNASQVFKDCGPYLGFFGFRIDNEAAGDVLDIAYVEFYSYNPQTGPQNPEDTTPEPEETIPEGVEIYLSADKAYQHDSGSSATQIGLSADGKYYTISPNGNNIFTLWQVATDVQYNPEKHNYIVFKVRANGADSFGFFNLYLGFGAHHGSNPRIYAQLNNPAVSSGEWVTYVVEVDKMTVGGTCSGNINFIKLLFQSTGSGNLSAECRFDLEYFAVCNTVDGVLNVIDQDTVLYFAGSVVSKNVQDIK